MEESASPSAPPRRDFLKKIAALGAGALALVVPAVGGLLVLFDPLRRRRSGGTSVRVTSIDSVPDDGTPRKFQVLATRVDAWNRTPDVPVGAVYLRRRPDGGVQAFNVVCPHAGCFVDYLPGEGHYHCPCHNSTFAMDGAVQDPKSPSPRGLDELDAEVREDGAVWVAFSNFRAGVKEKIPV